MNRVYIIIFCFGLLLICFETKSQIQYPGPLVPYESCVNCILSNYQYSGLVEYFDTEHIVSDFGPRYLSANTPYDFHGGIDYTITTPFNGPPDDLGVILPICCTKSLRC